MVELTHSALPPGTRISIGQGLDGQPVIELRLRVRSGTRRRCREVVMVAPAREMRALGLLLVRQADILDCVIPAPFGVIAGGRR